MRACSGSLKLDDNCGGACNARDDHLRAPERPCRFDLVGTLPVGFAALFAIHIEVRLVCPRLIVAP